MTIQSMQVRERKVDIRIDFENIYIGLSDKSLIGKVIKVIREQAEQLGEVVNMIAYADFDELSHGNSQKILELQNLLNDNGADIQPLTSINGKNSADIELICDVWKNMADPKENIDIFVLVSGDRDFRRIVKDIKDQGKEAHLISWIASLNKNLVHIATKTYILEDLLGEPPKPDDKRAALAIQFMALLNHKRSSGVYASEVANKAIANKLTWGEGVGIFTKQKGRFYPNNKHSLIKVATELVKWVPWRVAKILDNKKSDDKFHYIKTNYLRNGMKNNKVFNKLGVRQYSEGEKWLNLVAETDLVIKTECPHYRNPKRTDTAWSLPS